MLSRQLNVDSLRSTHALPGRWVIASCIGFASLLVLFMHGYQFGRSNHTVYLLDALRHADPSVLRNDWFATQTLQYHAAFGWLTRWLFAAHIVRPAFLIAYILLIVLFNLAAWRIVFALGGSIAEYLLCIALFYLSAAGTGLGMYQFFQDSSFLPSNVAAVAMLWAMADWLDNRPLRCAIALGIAGLFHLNYALIAPLMWILLILPRRGCPMRDRATWRIGLIATAIVFIPSMVNIAFAFRAAMTRTGQMPLGEFVDLYVRLRHPHHYDPSSWPAWLWISFLWPIPLTIAAYIRRPLRDGSRAWRESLRLLIFFCLLLVIALLGAGLFYVSEPLIQASLYRFSVFLKLLTCAVAALWIVDRGRRWISSRGWALISLAVFAGLMIGCLLRGPYIGLFHLIRPSPAFDAMCDWVRLNTPRDAIFVTPPDEDDSRLRARRAIVVDYKAVPQISGELRIWRDRLENVLGLADLRTLPHGFEKTLDAIHDRYRALPADHLIDVAHRYHARYVISATRWPGRKPIHTEINGNPTWFLYDLAS